MIKKRILLFCIVLVSDKFSFAQNNRFNNLLDSARIFFEREKGLDQDKLDALDYNKAAAEMEEAVQLNPQNSEAHYLLGYVYSRINSRDGRSMVDMSAALTEKCSKQFEEVIRLTPHYTGKIVVLDPYSKIGSEWGALALSYWHNNRADSAVWAFEQGKKRGGFGDYILAINRKVLDACSKNAILVSSGDNFTILLYYLQLVEHYRSDVSIVDISMLNTRWYPKLLAERAIVKFDVPLNDLDSVDYLQWHDSLVHIGRFSWLVKPSYYDQYVLRGDRLFLSLLKATAFERDIYFTKAFPEVERLSLQNYLLHQAVVDKLQKKKQKEQSTKQTKEELNELMQLCNYLNTNSPDQLSFFDIYRYQLLYAVDDALQKKRYKQANSLLQILDAAVDENKYPFQDPKGKEYAGYLRQQLLQKAK